MVKRKTGHQKILLLPVFAVNKLAGEDGCSIKTQADTVFP